MVPPPIQSRHRKPITYGRISRSSSANFKVFQDTVEGSNRNEEPRATVPRRIRTLGLLPPSLPPAPMAEQSLLRSESDCIYHIGDDNGGDPFSDPPALNPQASTEPTYTKEAKQPVPPPLPRKIALAEKSANYPILRNTTVAITSDAASPYDTGRTSGPPPRPHKVHHYTPSIEDQDSLYLLSPSKSRSPISKNNFRRFSTRAWGEEVNRPYNTPPAGLGIDQHRMIGGNTRAGTWVRGKARYLAKKTAEKMGSSPPARCKSQYEGVIPIPLEKASRGGAQKTLSPRYSVERMKRRRKGYEPVPATTDRETGYESNEVSSVKDPFASGQDDDFEHGIFAGESSDYVVEIPKRRRNFQEPYVWSTKEQNTQNLLAQTKEMDPSMESAGTKNRSRKFKYDAESEDRNSGEAWNEQESTITIGPESLMAYMSDSGEDVCPGSVARSTSKRQSWDQLRTHIKNKSKKRAGKFLPLQNKRNSRSKFLELTGDTDTDSTVDSGAKGSTVYVAQKASKSISTVNTSGGTKHHDVRNDKFVRNKKLDEDCLGLWDSPGDCKPSPDSLPVRASPQKPTYPEASQAWGETEDVRQDSSIPNAGSGRDTRSSASLDTRRMQGNRQSENGKPVTRLEDPTIQDPIRAHRNISANIVRNKLIGSHTRGTIPLREKSPKGIPYNTKRKKDAMKAKPSKSKMEMACEDDDVDELQMDLPGMRI